MSSADRCNGRAGVYVEHQALPARKIQSFTSTISIAIDRLGKHSVVVVEREIAKMALRTRAMMMAMILLCYFYLDFVKMFNHLEQAKAYIPEVALNYTSGISNYTSDFTAGLSNYTSEMTAGLSNYTAGLTAGLSDFTGTINFPAPVKRSIARGGLPQMSLPPDPLIFFVHVGKAGGATIYRELNKAKVYKELGDNLKKKKAALRCRMENSLAGNDDDDGSCYQPEEDETKLGSLVIGRSHVTGEKYSKKERKWMLSHADLFIFSVRDPIARIVSAYNYHKADRWARASQRKFYKKCFNSGLDKMVDIIVNYDGDEESILSCKQQGLSALEGHKKHRMGPHFTWGYARYWDAISMDQHPNRTIAVIRTEQLWEDMSNLDVAVGGSGHDFLQEGKAVKHVSHEKYKTELSPINTKYLCCIMHRDIDTYQTLILRAANLEDTQKRETLDALYSHCDVGSTGDVLADPFSWYSFYETTCAELLKTAD